MRAYQSLTHYSRLPEVAEAVAETVNLVRANAILPRMVEVDAHRDLSPGWGRWIVTVKYEGEVLGPVSP